MNYYVEKRTVGYENVYFLQLGMDEKLIIYVTPEFVKEDEMGNSFIDLPLSGCEVERLDDGCLYLKRGNKNLFLTEDMIGNCGNMSASCKVVNNDVEVFEFRSTYSSSEGRVGALISSESEEVKVYWSRNCSGNEKKWTEIINLDGKITGMPCHL